MLIPIRHENMEARRWPVITIGLIVLNTLIFLITHGTMEQQSPELGSTKAHIILLAGMHPELNMSPEARQLVEGFKAENPTEWTQVQSPTRDLIDGWDARIRLVEEPAALQAEMDSLSAKYSELATGSLQEKYAFVPAHPRAITYVTANFLHGGWLHLIGNMWFLWLAGFVLEDVWGRPLYMAFYLIAGAAALQFHAWTNPGSIIPCVGASGAVAALMGAFLVRFPKMKIELLWIFGFFRTYRFKAAAYWLLPLWVLMEVFYGSLFGKASGVAHWAHVGGFAFGALGAVALRYSGLETHVNKKVEKELTWACDPEIERANQHLEQGQLDEAVAVLQPYLSAKPNSMDGWNLLRQIHWRRSELPAYQQATAKTCELHLKAKNPDGAWQDYEDFLNSGGQKLPAATWFELCRMLEERESYDRALSELESLIQAYPSERTALMAQMAAARIYLKRLNRPEDALKFYQAAAVSPVPHLDLEHAIQAGIKEVSAARAGGQSASVTAGT
ncbi:MAG: rhomboid family intramembrane serine protease [Acidobacteriia bacterium]|nr:rhomboid family intramembrane serine protease [Terriglobia bacterium]